MSGGTPAAPGAIFVPPGGGSPPDAPGEIYVPPLPSVSIPETVIVSGITSPAASDPLTLALTAVVDGKPRYELGSWELYHAASYWNLVWDGVYTASLESDAASPVGLGFPAPTMGTGIPICSALSAGAIFTPPSAGSPPAGAGAIFTPPSAGSPPAAAGAIFAPPIDGGSPSAPPPIFGAPLNALYNSNFAPLLNTNDAILTNTDA